MARSPTDAQEMVAEAKRSPSQPAAMMISRLTNDYDVPAPSSRPTEDVGMRHVQENPEDNPELALAPKPCERCVRTGRMCRGVANARCVHCKKLKQKCSNSTGPARGKHAAAARLATSGASPSRALPAPHVTPAGPSASMPLQGQKRKLEDRQDGPSYRHSLGNVSAREEEESDEGHDGVPARFNKKRRTAMSSAFIASRVLGRFRELEASVRHLSEVYNSEVGRIDRIIAQLSRDVETLTGDSERSEREPSL